MSSITIKEVGAASTDYQVIATGTGTADNSVLTTLDPTMMMNGLYHLIIEATDVGGSITQESTLISIEGRLKLGNFSITLQDLSIPLSGIPISISRTYDSRQKHKTLDFGKGWSIDYQNISISENRNLGEGWNLVNRGGGMFSNWCIEPSGPHYVSISLPSGETEKFDMSVSPQCGGFFPSVHVKPVFTSRNGSSSKLETNETTLRLNGDSLLDIFGTVTTYDPSDYILTTSDGRRYELNEQLGIEKIEDRNGNWVAYSDNGVQHSSGKGVSFLRDVDGKIIGITDPENNQINYSYEASGNLTAVADREGNTTTYSYDGSHGLVETYDPLGRKIGKQIYDEKGRLVAYEDANGKRFEFSVDTDTRTKVSHDADGGRVISSYDAKGNLIELTKADGNTWKYEYDSNGNTTKEIDPKGNAITKAWDQNSNLVSTTGKLGNTVSYIYDDYGSLISKSYSNGAVESILYDDYGNRSADIDALGNTTHYEYDEKGNLTKETDALGNEVANSYDDFGNKSSSTSKSGLVTTYIYDANGIEISRAIQYKDEAGEIYNVSESQSFDKNAHILSLQTQRGSNWTYSYNENGSRTSKVGLGGLKTLYEYDTYGNLTKTIYPNGAIIENEFDEKGNIIKSINEKGDVTVRTYDSNSNLLSEVGPHASITNAYNELGYLVSRSDELVTTDLEYDAVGNVTQESNTLGQVRSYTYDVMGNRTFTTDENNYVVEYVYDLNNRLLETKYPDETKIESEYDKLGREISKTDRKGNKTEYKYDASSHLVEITNALGQVTKYEYDSRGSKVSETTADGDSTRWVYNEKGKLTSKTLPAGQKETFAYDANNRLSSKIDFNGLETSYVYDALGRNSESSFNEVEATVLTRNDSGKITAANINGETTQYDYNSQGRLIKETSPENKITTYQYDGKGNRTQIAIDGSSTEYQYNTDNVMSAIKDKKDGEYSYSYDNLKRLIQISLANGSYTQYEYSDEGYVGKIAHFNSVNELLLSTSYDYDPNGNIIGLEQSDGKLTQYTYDALNRITAYKIYLSDVVIEEVSYAYDVTSNIIQKTKNGIVTSYVYDANDRLLSAGDIAYEYDPAGNLTKRTNDDGEYTFSYGLNNLRTQSVTPSGTFDYRYDYRGLRTAKITEGQTTAYLLDNTFKYPEIAKEMNLNTGQSIDYTHDQFSTLAEHSEIGSSYILANQSGSSQLITTENEDVTAAYEYDPYGQVNSDDPSVNHLYNGEYHDDELNEVYLRARSYDPQSMRFTQMDTWQGNAVNPITLNKYLYANANPVMNIDPSGHFAAAITLQAQRATRAMGYYQYVLQTLFGLGLTGAVTEEIYDRWQLNAQYQANAGKAMASTEAAVTENAQDKGCDAAPLLFHYTHPAYAPKIYGQQFINPTRAITGPHKFFPGWDDIVRPYGAYATTITPWQPGMTKKKLALTNYKLNGASAIQRFKDGYVNAFVSLCNNGF